MPRTGTRSTTTASVVNDGQDYPNRQTVAEHYLISAQYKRRLKWSILFHTLLFLLMVVKLIPDVLDRLDIFVLPLEELEIPKPVIFEYIWCLSIISTWLALTAMKKNAIELMNNYMRLIASLGVTPLCTIAAVNFSDVKLFITDRYDANIVYWKGYPVSVMWYAFVFVAIQVHILSLFCADKLVRAWISRESRKKH